MPSDGKLSVGEVLDDWQAAPGTRTVVVSVLSGKLPSRIDLTSSMRGSSAESCALYGGPAHSDTQPKPRKVTP
jgi:hypothetical protein